MGGSLSSSDVKKGFLSPGFESKVFPSRNTKTKLKKPSWVKFKPEPGRLPTPRRESPEHCISSVQKPVCRFRHIRALHNLLVMLVTLVAARHITRICFGIVVKVSSVDLIQLTKTSCLCEETSSHCKRKGIAGFFCWHFVWLHCLLVSGNSAAASGQIHRRKLSCHRVRGKPLSRAAAAPSLRCGPWYQTRNKSEASSFSGHKSHSQSLHGKLRQTAVTRAPQGLDPLWSCTAR